MVINVSVWHQCENYIIWVTVWEEAVVDEYLGQGNLIFQIGG